MAPTLATAAPADDQDVAPNRTTIGFAIILTAALLAIAVAMTRTEPPGGGQHTPVRTATH
jgi:hypothetical protein